MNRFDLDQDKCTGCGICSEVCPVGMIELKEQHPGPRPTVKYDRICINCHHCVMVCPHGALSLNHTPIQQYPPVREDFFLNPEQVHHFFRSRRSIRAYKEKTVEPEILTRIIEIASFAPTSSNSQPVHWLVVYNGVEVKRMEEMVIDWMRCEIDEHPLLARANFVDAIVADYESGMSPICRGAPHIVVVHAAQESKQAPINCAIALTYLELALISFGLGGCWAGYFNLAAAQWKPLKNALGFPPNHTAFGSMLVGYPKFKYQRLPPGKEPRITWL